jgi:acetoacetate decarboxylase
MARLRYVQSPAPAAPVTPAAGSTQHTVRSLRALYTTHPEIVAALLPRPLVPGVRPQIFVQFAHVAMHLTPERTVTIGAATVGVSCLHEGQPGYYVLAMPMEGEFVVIGGREKFGEPKKIAETRFELGDEVDGRRRVNAQVTRQGVTFLELGGLVGEPLDRPKQFTEHFFCFKGMPTCEPAKNTNGGFDGEVFLTRLVWERDYSSVRRVHDASLTLRESRFDPLVDVPVLSLDSMEFAEGRTQTRGEVLRAVPGEWLAPFWGQRYDTPQAGVEVALASEASGSTDAEKEAAHAGV